MLSNKTKLILDIPLDLKLLKESLESISSKLEWNQNQISLQHRVGIEDENDGVGSLLYTNVKSDIEFSEFYESIENEYIVKVLQVLPFVPYRVRLMKIDPKKCYTMHRDKSIRFHIPIITAEDKGRFIFDSCKEVPGGDVVSMEEGSLYILNTKLPHTAMNCHPKMERIHIVGCMEEKEETQDPFMLNVYEEFGI